MIPNTQLDYRHIASVIANEETIKDLFEWNKIRVNLIIYESIRN